MGIVEFLTARLDEDEQLAREASAFYDDDQTNGVPWSGHEGVDPNGGERYWIAPHLGVVNHVASGRHIGRHAPARVLREVAFKRRIVELHTTGVIRTYQCSNGDHIQEWQCERAREPYDETRYCEQCDRDCVELPMMAELFTEHPDYDPIWAVQ